MQDEELKLDEKAKYEKLVREQINAGTAMLYDQKVNEMRREFEMKFELEVRKMQSQVNKENSQIPTFSDSSTSSQVEHAGRIENPEVIRQRGIFPKTHRTAFTEFPTTIRTRDDDDSDGFEQSQNTDMRH